MNLLVLGATGGTGRLVVEQALAAGHTVTALVRSPEKLATSQPNLRVVTGSATDPESVAGAMEGADAVISTLGGGGSVIADSTAAIVAAARQTGVRRVDVLSSWLVQQDRMSPLLRLATGIAMGGLIKDKSAGEQLLRQSDLDWTIVYASTLGDGPATGSTVLPEGVNWSMSQKVSRADVATWLIQAATDGQPGGRSVRITGGTSTKEDVQLEAVTHE
jgi:uncharacterized protein YbjT (DUF2867 family)